MSDLQPVTPKPVEEVERIAKALERPHPNLLWLYMITSLVALVAAPFVMIPLYFRYHTLRYRLSDDGVHASWGILLRREVSLTYARIQDIHLSRGPIERWLGLGTVQIQTASGSGSADLAIEGIQEFVEVRDFLYAKMRGATAKHPTAGAPQGAVVSDEAVKLLVQIRDDLHAVTEKLGAPRA